MAEVAALTNGGVSAVAPSPDALKIFISYSRRDLAAADAMVAALEGHGFSVTIDRRDLPYGEEWQKELAGFIAASDTVVWLVSPDSVKSKWVNWELGEVGRLSKRLIPVKVRETPPEELPEALGRIHLLPAEGAYDPAKHEPDLVKALNTDRAWLKRATSLGDDAREWMANGRDRARLIRGAALSEAEAWSVRKPADAPAPSSDILELILASRAAQRRGQRITVAGSLAAAVVAIGLAATAIWFGFEARDQADEAERQRLAAEEQARIAGEREIKATANETVALASLSGVALAGASLPEAVKLAIASWPRKGSEARPQTERAITALVSALSGLRERARMPGYLGLLSPDRQSVLTADRSGPMQLWTLSGKPVGAPMQSDSMVFSAAFSADGKRIASGAEDGVAHLWDVAAGRVEKEYATEDGAIAPIAFSPDGRTVMLATQGRTVLWDTSSGTAIDASSAAGTGAYFADFSPDGRRLVGGFVDGSVEIWDVATGAQESHQIRHRQSVTAVRFAPDGSRILTASMDGSVRLWDAVTGAPVGIPMLVNLPVMNAAFSPDGGRVAAVSVDKVRLFNGISGAPGGYEIAHDGVTTAVFSPDSRQLMTASDEGTVLFWDATSGLPAGIAPLTHQDGILSATYADGGATVVTASREILTRVWHVADNSVEASAVETDASLVGVAVSADGSLLATASMKGAALWDTASGRKITELGPADGVSSIQLSPDASRVLTTNDDQTLRLWDAKTGAPVGAPVKQERGTLSSAFSTDGSVVFSMDRGGTVRMLGASTGEMRGSTVKCGSLPVGSALEADRRSIIAIEPEGAVLRCDLAGAAPEIVAEIGGELSQAFVFPAAGRAVVLTSTGDAQLWDTNRWRRIGAPLERGVKLLNWELSSDGARLLVVSSEGDVTLWDAATGSPVWRLRGKQVYHAVFESNGERLVTAGQDGFARFWDISAVGKGDAFQIACQRLGNNTSLEDVRERYGLGELSPICGDNPPLPVDWSKLE